MNKKSDFVNFLFENKYKEEFTTFKDLIIKYCDIDTILKLYNTLKNEVQDKEKISNLLLEIDTKLEELSDKKSLKYKKMIDVLFCLINTDKCTVKLLKDKNCKVINLIKEYQDAFTINKSYLKLFNTKEKVEKVSIKENKPEVTRFAPEPAGCLHIGHVKALLVNYNLVKNTQGKLFLRFDDTNPIKDHEFYEKEIIKDMDALNIKDYIITHSSDYFDLLVEKAIFLIKAGLAYCDNTEQLQMRSERMDGIESKCRQNSINFNLLTFTKMLQGQASGYCLRAKINMSNPNKTMRDPVIYRLSNKVHHRCSKYKSYPTYDFVCPILDSIEGITKACRANEYRDRNDQYKWILNNLQLENKPILVDFSKLNFENTVLSKRKIISLIEEGHVTGWDDPRLCTIRGIKRNGMDLEALKEYINLQGASNKTNTISWDKVWAMNKKAIDSISPRFMAVEMKDHVIVKLLGKNNLFIKQEFLNKKNISLGAKDKVYDTSIVVSQEDAQILSEGEEFTLMSWGNAIVQNKIVVDGLVKEIQVRLHIEGDYKKTKNKISWVSYAGSVIVKGTEYTNILEGEEINLKSKDEVFYLVESSILKNVHEGMHVQFERVGFFYCDGMYQFNLVPYTKQKKTFNK